MSELVRPYSYLDEFIDCGMRADKTREELIQAIEEHNKEDFKRERKKGYDKGYEKGLEKERKDHTEFEDRWKIAFKRETAEKEDYVRMYFIFYEALTESVRSPEEVLAWAVKYLDAEFDKVFEHYEDILPVGLVESDPRDPKLLAKITERAKAREKLLGEVL